MTATVVSPVNSLYPTFPVPRTVGVRQARTGRSAVRYPDGMLWDFARGDFVYDASGNPVTCDGYTNWQQWCVHAVTTQRYTFLAMPRWYGVDFEGIQNLDQSEAEAQAIREITEALTIDLRTGAVDRFVFTSNGDAAYITFRVRPAVPVVGPDFPMIVSQ